MSSFYTNIMCHTSKHGLSWFAMLIINIGLCKAGSTSPSFISAVWWPGLIHFQSTDHMSCDVQIHCLAGFHIHFFKIREPSLLYGTSNYCSHELHLTYPDRVSKILYLAIMILCYIDVGVLLLVTSLICCCFSITLKFFIVIHLFWPFTRFFLITLGLT